MNTPQTIHELLKPTFSRADRHLKAALDHYSKMMDEHLAGDAEWCVAKGGKFIEAVLKALYVFTGKTLPRPRDFKASLLIGELGRLEKDKFDDTIRLLIPRACQFAYDIASNRGGRHDAADIDPNQMDANAMVSVCSWILAEMVRYSQVGVLSPEDAQTIVDSLSQKKYPFLEEVDGRLYFHKQRRSARDVALVVLWKAYPRRVASKDLKQAIIRHRYSGHNAGVALTRVKHLVDDDGAGNLKLLTPGLEEAESIIKPHAERKN